MSSVRRRRKSLVIAAMGALALSSVATTVLVFVAVPAAATGSPAARYDVINGTANAGSDHEIAGSTAFPNFNSGAVDNYYALAHAYVDNSPFAEGTSSPADTGPIGQTAAAGNFEQPQYADARWPGKNSGKATVGHQGGPYAVAAAGTYKGTATATEASNGSAAAVPRGFVHRLRLALRAWKARWHARLHLKIPGVSGGARSLAAAGITVPTVTVPTTPTPTVTVPTTPTVTVPKPPPVTVPKKRKPPVTVPTVTTPLKKSHKPSRSHTRTKSSSSPDGESLLRSTTLAELDPHTGALVTSGESSVGSVSLGNGQIVIKGIDVTATITNRGTPTQKISVDVASASVGGVPVTIDQHGVHVKGQGQALPYSQADAQLNGALKQAGIKLFTVAPEIKKVAHGETITATGVHVVFTQPVHQSGVPDQNFEHVLGEVYVDSLATPALPLPNLHLSGGGGGSTSGSGSGSSGPPPTSSSTGPHTTTIPGTAPRTSTHTSYTRVPGTAGTAGTQGTSSQPGSGYSSSSQPTSSSTGTPSQAGGPSVLTALRKKPLWLLVTYLVWQALVIGTGVSLRRWGLGGAA